MRTRREHINLSASRLFRNRGFVATSMQDIANELGIKAASLYNHINSKQEILRDLLMPIADDFTAGMKDIQACTLGSREKLEALVGLHVKITLENKDRMALITGEWVHLHADDLKSYKKSRSKYEKHFKDILIECEKEQLLKSQVNIDLALFSILSSLHWLYSWYERHQKIGPIELEQQLKECLLKGILKN